MKGVQQRCMLAKQQAFDLKASEPLETQQQQLLNAAEPCVGLAKPVSDIDMEHMYSKGFAMMQKMGFTGAGAGLGREGQGIAQPVDAMAGARVTGHKRGLGSTLTTKEACKLDKLGGNKPGVSTKPPIRALDIQLQLDAVERAKHDAVERAMHLREGDDTLAHLTRRPKKRRADPNAYKCLECCAVFEEWQLCSEHLQAEHAYARTKGMANKCRIKGGDAENDTDNKLKLEALPTTCEVESQEHHNDDNAFGEVDATPEEEGERETVVDLLNESEPFAIGHTNFELENQEHHIGDQAIDEFDAIPEEEEEEGETEALIDLLNGTEPPVAAGDSVEAHWPDSDEADGVVDLLNESELPPAVGDVVEAYWPDSDEWLVAVVHHVFGNGDLEVHWEPGHEQSRIPASYARRPVQRASKTKNISLLVLGC